MLAEKVSRFDYYMVGNRSNGGLLEKLIESGEIGDCLPTSISLKEKSIVGDLLNFRGPVYS